MPSRLRQRRSVAVVKVRLRSVIEARPKELLFAEAEHYAEEQPAHRKRRCAQCGPTMVWCSSLLASCAVRPERPAPATERTPTTPIDALSSCVQCLFGRRARPAVRCVLQRQRVTQTALSARGSCRSRPVRRKCVASRQRTTAGKRERRTAASSAKPSHGNQRFAPSHTLNEPKSAGRAWP